MSDRVVYYHGVQVLAPVCPDCESDQKTRWIALPSLADVRGGGTAFCEGVHCREEFHAFGADCFRAREPERLAARLQELKAEGWK